MSKEHFFSGEGVRDKLGKVTDLLDLRIQGSEVLEGIDLSGAILAIAPHNDIWIHWSSEKPCREISARGLFSSPELIISRDPENGYRICLPEHTP